MNKITKYWIEHAKYDLKTAKAMFKTKRYLYVLFMCQQSLEKLLKAHITIVTKETPPRTHNLIRLVQLTNLNEVLANEEKEFLAELTPFCIETRYAEYIEKLRKLTNKELSKKYLIQTDKVFKWIREKLK